MELINISSSEIYFIDLLIIKVTKKKLLALDLKKTIALMTILQLCNSLLVEVFLELDEEAADVGGVTEEVFCIFERVVLVGEQDG